MPALDQVLKQPYDSTRFIFDKTLSEQIGKACREVFNVLLKQKLEIAEAKRKPYVLQSDLVTGLKLAIDQEFEEADRILGSGLSQSMFAIIDRLVKKEKSNQAKTQGNMDTEFHHISELSSDLENSVNATSLFARDAAKANRIAFEARDIAAQNKDIVDEMVASISSISKSSEKIDNIARSINSIAFQTNLIALNASLEAARAGKAGKGFGVVATEVRALARQSSKAAEQTQELTDKIIQQIKTAETQVRQTSEAFSSLSERSDNAGIIIKNIQESSHSRSQDIDRIHVKLIQTSVSLKQICKGCRAIGENRQTLSPELILPKTYRIQTQWYPQAQFAGYYVAMEKGYYEEAGLRVELVDGGAESNALHSLVKGEIDFATAWLSSALTVFERGARIHLMSQLFQKSGLMLVALKTSSIRNIKDLKQKTISSWGGIFEYPIQAMNLEHNLDMEILDLGADISRIQSGEIDVMAVMSYNELTTLLDQGFSREDLVLIRLSEVGYNFPEDGLYTSKDLFLNDPEACRQFNRATIRGWKAAINDKEMALECSWTHHARSAFPTSKSHQRKMLEEVGLLTGSSLENLGILNEEGFMKTQKALKRIGMIQKTVQYADFYLGDNCF